MSVNASHLACSQIRMRTPGALGGCIITAAAAAAATVVVVEGLPWLVTSRCAPVELATRRSLLPFAWWFSFRPCPLRSLRLGVSDLESSWFGFDFGGIGKVCSAETGGGGCLLDGY
jgi:hypothetical protein